MKEKTIHATRGILFRIGGKNPGVYHHGKKLGIVRFIAETRADSEALRVIERNGITPHMIAESFDIRKSFYLAPEKGVWVEEDTPVLIYDIERAEKILRKHGLSRGVIRFLKESYWGDRDTIIAFAQKHFSGINRAVRDEIKKCNTMREVRHVIKTAVPHMITTKYVKHVILPRLEKRMRSARNYAYKKRTRYG